MVYVRPWPMCCGLLTLGYATVTKNFGRFGLGSVLNIFASAHFFCHLDSSLRQSGFPLARCLLALFALVCMCWFHLLALGIAPATRLYLTSDYFTSPIECLPNIFFSCSTTCCAERPSAPSAPDDLSYFGDDLSCVCSCLHSFFARRCHHLYSL